MSFKQLSFKKKCLVVFCLMALAWWLWNRWIPPMNTEEKKLIDSWTQTMRPRCFGRYLIDLPSDWRSQWKMSTARHSEILIEVRPIDRELFNAHLKRLEDRYKKQRSSFEDTTPGLQQVVELPNQEGKLFNRLSIGPAINLGEPDHFDESEPIEVVGGSNAGRTLEIAAYKNGYFINMRSKASDFTFPEFVNDTYAKKRGSDVAEKQAELLALYQHVHGRRDDEIPSVSGMCFDGGFIEGAPTRNEEIEMVYVAPTPDVRITLSSYANVRESTTLLDRSLKIHASLLLSGIKTVGNGKRQGQGIDFEEWLMEGPTQEKITGHMFTAEAFSKEGSATTPMIILNFYNGERPSNDDVDNPRAKLKQATLSLSQSVALWNRITKTLRKRPNAF